VTFNGSAAIRPVNGDAELAGAPLEEETPESMYWYSSSEILRVLAVQKHCARNASSMSPANTCGLPTLNSLTTWSMNPHLYHAARANAQKRFSKKCFRPRQFGRCCSQ